MDHIPSLPKSYRGNTELLILVTHRLRDRVCKPVPRGLGCRGIVRTLRVQVVWCKRSDSTRSRTWFHDGGVFSTQQVDQPVKQDNVSQPTRGKWDDRVHGVDGHLSNQAVRTK